MGVLSGNSSQLVEPACIYDLRDLIVYQSRFYVHFYFQAFWGLRKLGSWWPTGGVELFLSCQEVRFDFTNYRAVQLAQT